MGKRVVHSVLYWIAVSFVAGTLTVVGCATPSQGRRETAMLDRASQTQQSSPTRKPSPAASAPVREEPMTTPGGIARLQLKSYVRQGPHRFIQQVRVRPTFRGGRFFGWRIQSYGGPGPVKTGDVVTRVNGKSLERPEQFMKVWENLVAEPELVVELVRSGQPVTLRYPIVD